MQHAQRSRAALQGQAQIRPGIETADLTARDLVVGTPGRRGQGLARGGAVPDSDAQVSRGRGCGLQVRQCGQDLCQHGFPGEPGLQGPAADVEGVGKGRAI